MRRPRPHVSMGPEGTGKARLGATVSVHDLPGYLDWYERIASELAAGRRQLVVDGETVPAEQAVSLAHRLLDLAEQARYFPAQVREGWESRNDGVSDRRERKRILAQVPDVIVEFVSEAYVAGITLGVLGARVAVEELTALLEKGWAQDETARDTARRHRETFAGRDARWCARGADLAKTEPSERKRARIIVEEEQAAKPARFYSEDNVRRVLRRKR